MKWPRGRYNGRRIVGAGCSLAFHVSPSYLRPRVSWNSGEPYFIWLIFTIRWWLVYDYK